MIKSNQVETLLDHMRRVGSITNIEAQAVYRIRALPRRIADLEERGFIFERQNKADETGQRYVRYVFKGHRDNARKYLKHVNPRLMAHA